MTDERDSQLSAMFDGELPAGECELLARRLTRDDALRALWSRYSVIGAALRAERGVALHDRVAWRVQNAIAQEAVYGEGTSVGAAASARNPIMASTDKAASAGERWMRIARPVAGTGIAAAVAAVSILWLRNQEAPAPLMASAVAPVATVEAGQGSSSLVAAATPSETMSVPVSNGEPDRYVTPQPSNQTNLAPPARLANYVVAHSEYSGPLARRLALLGLVATDPTDVGSIPENADVSVEANDAP